VKKPPPGKQPGAYAVVPTGCLKRKRRYPKYWESERTRFFSTGKGGHIQEEDTLLVTVTDRGKVYGTGTSGSKLGRISLP